MIVDHGEYSKYCHGKGISEAQAKSFLDFVNSGEDGGVSKWDYYKCPHCQDFHVTPIALETKGKDDAENNIT